MLPGYNHNIIYKEQQFHIQTEDSGLRNPHIITLLYRDGVIINSKKTGYADILKVESLGDIVEDLMKEQHKDMLRRLKRGDFDVKITAIPQGVMPVATGKTDEKPETAGEANGLHLLFEDTVPIVSVGDEQVAMLKTTGTKKAHSSLDDAILEFFGAAG